MIFTCLWTKHVRTIVRAIIYILSCCIHFIWNAVILQFCPLPARYGNALSRDLLKSVLDETIVRFGPQVTFTFRFSFFRFSLFRLRNRLRHVFTMQTHIFWSRFKLTLFKNFVHWHLDSFWWFAFVSSHDGLSCCTSARSNDPTLVLLTFDANDPTQVLLVQTFALFVMWCVDG